MIKKLNTSKILDLKRCLKFLITFLSLDKINKNLLKILNVNNTRKGDPCILYLVKHSNAIQASLTIIIWLLMNIIFNTTGCLINYLTYLIKLNKDIVKKLKYNLTKSYCLIIHNENIF